MICITIENKQRVQNSANADKILLDFIACLYTLFILRDYVQLFLLNSLKVQSNQRLGYASEIKAVA